LGGRCDHFHGVVVGFSEVYNLTRWEDMLHQRELWSNDYGWNGFVKMFGPKFHEKSYAR